jgi:threonine dehydrogenase-like Zn-dependent dehydrogenase
MISFDRVRLAERRKVEAFIAAQPSPARFERMASIGGPVLTFAVRTDDPRKMRDMKAGGFDPRIEAMAWIVMPLIAQAPQPAKEFISIVDLGGDYKDHEIITVTALRGLSCYQVGLRSRKNAPTLARPSAL